MDDFAKLPKEERRLYFEQAAAQLGLSAQIIEKDFWVCWSLKRLFSLESFRGHLTFKGGTSLSKVYGVIDRFSEDVDVAIERGVLGFGGDNEPEKGQSKKAQQRRIDDLKAACQATVAGQLKPKLAEAIATALASNSHWSLALDPNDPDQQSVIFQYPPAIDGSLSPYFASSVKIELGARSDHFPVETASVKPYLSDAFPQAFSQIHVPVRVLVAARTFWEKATILHRIHHLPEGKAMQPRMSRHYYDVFQLSRGPLWDEVLGSVQLLDRVVEQTIVFFKRAWARYDEATLGKLRLTPPERMMASLKQDYRDMRPMFFNDPPSIDEILDHLPGLEKQINQHRR